MSNYDAANEIFTYIGEKVEVTLKKGEVMCIKITEVLRNKITMKPATIYFVDDNGRRGFVDYEDVRYCLEADNTLEEPLNPEVLGREVRGVKTYNK